MKINIRVITNAKKSRIMEEENGLKVYVTALPVDNKANIAVIKVLADYFNTKKKSITIVKGSHSRNKVVKINDRND